MPSTVFFAVLFAAILHASWNAVIKNSADKYLSMTAVVVGHAPLAILALPFVTAPVAASWPYIALSIALHTGYQLFLLWAYRIGDMSQVYPIARGTAPIIVTLVSVLLLGEHLTPWQMLAVALIGLGIMSLMLVRNHDGLRNAGAAGLALITSLFIAGYTLTDGYGGRASTALGFYAYATLLNSCVFAGVMAAVKPGLLRRIWPEARTTMLIGGSASVIAYAIAMWGFTQAPIALVAALRETSIIAALLISTVVMKERLDLAKVVATFVTLAGAVMLRVAR